jgi:hypothetical protein
MSRSPVDIPFDGGVVRVVGDPSVPPNEILCGSERAFFGIDRSVDSTRLALAVKSDTFEVTIDQFRSAWRTGNVRFGHEHIDTYDRYDWSGRHYRRWLSMPGIEARWDGGDPGDEHDGE